VEIGLIRACDLTCGEEQRLATGAAEMLTFGAHVNETIFVYLLLRVEGQVFFLLRLEEADGVIHFGFPAFAAFGLETSELAESVLHRMVRMLFVSAEVYEGF